MSAYRISSPAAGIVLIITISLYVSFVADIQTTYGVIRAFMLAASHTPRNNLQQQEYDEEKRCNLMRVESAGNFTQKLAAFNAVLSSVRLTEFKRRGTGEWRPPTSSKRDIIRGERDEYLRDLCNSSSVTTVVVPWTQGSGSSTWNSLDDRSNLLIQTYYEWTADDKLCSWIETAGVTKMRKYEVLYRRTCHRNVDDTARPMSIRPLYLNGKPLNPSHYWPNNASSYPTSFYTDTPRYVSFMHIQQDVVITRLGDVIANGTQLVLYGCRNKPYVKPSLPRRYRTAPLYDEVFVISQYWGTGVFHRMTEVMPRAALYVPFLRANPQIRILGPEAGGRTGELLQIIGLKKSQLVTGSVRAKIVYQPRATGCGYANVQESQLVSHLYRDYIRRTFPAQLRNRLILVRRSRSRRFTEQGGIKEALKRAAVDYNLTFELFIDNPVPSLRDTMIMFHSAVMVVAPHGAGLSNVYFSQPGTYVIEGVCNLPHVNLCYQRLAHVLGHHWHGVTSRGGCPGVVDVPASVIEDAARQHLRLWSTHTG